MTRNERERSQTTRRWAVAVVGAATATLLMTSPSHLAHAGPGHGKDRARPAVQVATLKASAAAPVVGRDVALTGRITSPRSAPLSAARSARTVVLQSRTGAAKKWRAVARTRVTHRGTFRFTRPVAGTRPTAYRVVAAGLGKRKAISRAVVVRGRVVQTPRRKHDHVKRVRSVRPAPPAVAPVRPPTHPPVVAPDVQVRTELTRLVDTYRADNARRPAEANACLSEWADGFAARMADTSLFAHSGSWEWRVFDATHLSAQRACVGEAPGVVRQEAIAHVAGSDPVAAARAAFAELTSWWAHDAVLLDDFGTERVMSVGAAPADGDGWYVVVVFGAA